MSRFHYQQLVFEFKGRKFDEENSHTVIDFKTCSRTFRDIISKRYGKSLEALTKWYCECINLKCECKRFHIDSKAASSHTN